jgi:hypothetical protein
MFDRLDSYIVERSTPAAHFAVKDIAGFSYLQSLFRIIGGPQATAIPTRMHYRHIMHRQTVAKVYSG